MDLRSRSGTSHGGTRCCAEGAARLDVLLAQLDISSSRWRARAADWLGKKGGRIDFMGEREWTGLSEGRGWPREENDRGEGVGLWERKASFFVFLEAAA
uniref:Uncharacterized protein n=1 Tax=Oryza barthii TaxID=65489 RepID=A0A0D3H5J2_9ORYZ